MSEESTTDFNDVTEDQSILTKVDYPTGFHPDQAPVHLKFVCALQGRASPDIKSDFTYCELGCGPGETTAVLAASNPTGRFYGIDLNQAHIDWAHTLVAESELSNVEFIAADICEFDFETLPMFDFITMHGLYSWVPSSVQTAVRQFLAARLKPGGVVYVSYNALPGWGAISGMQRLFRELVPTDSSGSDTLAQAKHVIALLQEMEEKGAPFFQENPSAREVLKRLPSHDIRYVTHEYLSPDWRPRYFLDVCREMESAGLEYVGHGNIADNIPEYAVPEEFVSMVEDSTDWRSRESYSDFIVNRFFRRDIYIKPKEEDATGNPTEDSVDALQDTLFGLLCLPKHIPEQITIKDIGTISVNGGGLDSLKRLLETRVLTLKEIIDHPSMSNAIEGDAAKLIQALNIGGVLAPFVHREQTPEPGGSETIDVVPKINSVRLNSADWDLSVFALASPVTGSGIMLNQLETAILRGLQRPDALDWVLKNLNEHNIQLRPTDSEEFISDPAEERKALESVFQKFIENRLPKLAYLGVVKAGEA